VAKRVPTLRAPRRFKCLPVRPRAGAVAAAREHDRQRGHSAARGYDAQWRKARAGHLAHFPLCALCEARGLYTAATLVDHITPVQSAHDPLFYAPDNWQSLCRACHAQKTAHDRAHGLTRPSLNTHPKPRRR